jgi:hypothetical protein
MPIGFHFRAHSPLGPHILCVCGTHRQYARHFPRATASNCRGTQWMVVVVQAPHRLGRRERIGGPPAERGDIYVNRNSPAQLIERRKLHRFSHRPKRDIVMGYPTAEELREWFRLHEQGQASKFFELYVRDDVKWTVMVLSTCVCEINAVCRGQIQLRACILPRLLFSLERSAFCGKH